jgi:probable rRNA maturation factor
MSYQIDIQSVCDEILPFSEKQLNAWVALALKSHTPSAELTLRFVSTAEMTTLNHTYRHINASTNVLAFPASYPKDLTLDYPFLGDVVVCPDVLLKESQSLNKSLNAHWAHILIHGVLHLLGYDHMKEDETIIMQTTESQLLATLGFDNPYESSKTKANQIE